MEDAYITGLLPERFNQMLLFQSGFDFDKIREEEIWITDDLRFFSHKEVCKTSFLRETIIALLTPRARAGVPIERPLPREENDLCPWVRQPWRPHRDVWQSQLHETWNVVPDFEASWHQAICKTQVRGTCNLITSGGGLPYVLFLCPAGVLQSLFPTMP